MSTQKSLRRSQRQPMSCLNCVRRKIRCSKQCPCTSCIDRGEEETCRREAVQVVRNSKRRRVREAVSDDVERRGWEGIPAAEGSLIDGPEQPSLLDEACSNSTTSFTIPGTLTKGSAPNIQPDAVITLEFLTHGRQSILRMANDPILQVPVCVDQTTQITQVDLLSVYPEWDSMFTSSQSRELLILHQATLAWMHNVVHMPTFRAEFESYLHSAPSDRSWLALYYALLCTTVYHADEVELENLGIPSTLVRQLYDQSIRSLNEANFMAMHTLASVQTICVLLQVAYNLDQGDFISVLLSAAIRIAQSLGLHRLGPQNEAQCSRKDMSVDESLIEREVKKRTWWFLVRQDWLQIPFQNTFVIHANQFNTPMPLNCHEDEGRMILDGEIAVQPSETYTQTSYSNELHKVAIVIWKHHERVVTTGHRRNGHEDILRLYEHTLWADSVLKQKYNEMPSFLKGGERISAEVPLHVKRLYSVQLLSTAHKIHTIHRNFQLASFQDRAFAFTQQSCLAISQKCIKEIQTWPFDSSSHKMLKMWTVITHIITSCVSLTFASIFRNQNTLLYDGAEMKRLAKTGRDIIRSAEEWSSIARRGGALLDGLFEIEHLMCTSNNTQFKIEDIVRKVRGVEADFQGDLSLIPELADTFFDSIFDWEFT